MNSTLEPQICYSCKESKPLSEFKYNTKNHSYLKSCFKCSIGRKKSKVYQRDLEVRRLTKANDPH